MILVSLPCHNTPWLIRRAVDSILGQTHRDLTLVVVNDGGPAPWSELADITDRRLIRFDLEENRGRYYCDAVTLAANPHPYYTVHDSDDWSESTRLEELAAEIGDADVACDGYTRHGLNGKVDKILPQPALAGRRGTRSLAHIGHHRGLWKTDGLRTIGMNPAVRVGWDTYLMHFAALTLNVEWVKSYLYHQVRRKGSLTQSDQTGIASKHRADTIKIMDAMWADAQAEPERVPAICAPDPALTVQIEAAAARLRELL